MNRISRAALILVLCLVPNFTSRASSMLPITMQQHIAIADAIFRGEVLSLQSQRSDVDGHIFTVAAVRVDEVFKGTLPLVVNLVHAGGVVGNIGVMDGFDPQLKAGEERLFFVSRRADGTLFATRGISSAFLLPVGTNNSALPQFLPGEEFLGQLRKVTGAGPMAGSDLTDQAASPQTTTPLPPPINFTPFGNPVVLATNLLGDSNGIPARFTPPDRGETIPYLIDADFLPTGISLTNAVTAVQNALAAWTAVTSLKYKFMGIQSFGQASGNIQNEDGILRVQLHDHYNYIGGGNGNGDTLGVGGHVWVPHNLSPGWTTGGNVNGTDFHIVVNGFVVLSHTNVAMQTLATFTEVLTHEIGHTIGLAHSSNNQNETNTLLKQAIMYFEVHADGRGATLGAYDPPVARQVHPTNNTPPYCYNRMMDITTYQTPTNIANVNVVQLRGYDLQTTNLPFAITDGTANAGSFSLAVSNLTFTQSGFSGGPRLDPAGNSFYDVVYARCSDGTNAAPYILIRVLSLNPDTHFEGIPDAWRTTYFGNADPSIGANHHAKNDADGDGYNNLTEYLLGSDPTVKSSNLRITNFSSANIQWQAKPYEVYEILGTTNFSNWTRVINPVIPTTTNGTATAFTNGGPRQFFRVEKVP